MLDDKTLALLGDREAAERLTAAGVLLECPFCGEMPNTRIRSSSSRIELSVVCFECGIKKCVVVDLVDTEIYRIQYEIARLIEMWNTRASILTPTQLALLKIGAQPRVFEEEEK